MKQTYTQIHSLTTNKCLRRYAPHASIIAIAAWFIVIGLKVTINIAASLMSPMYLINSPYNIVHTIAVKAVKQSTLLMLYSLSYTIICRYNTNPSAYVLGTGIDHSQLLSYNSIIVSIKPDRQDYYMQRCCIYSFTDLPNSRWNPFTTCCTCHQLKIAFAVYDNCWAFTRQ